MNKSLHEAQTWVSDSATDRPSTPPAVLKYTTDTTPPSTPPAQFHEVVPNDLHAVFICPIAGNKQFLVVPYQKQPIPICTGTHGLLLLANAAATMRRTRLCNVCETAQLQNMNGTLRAHRNPNDRRLHCTGI
tara:strand:- start:622 stop:1017 length:396 start_codon:yes stop_codon:yes gene_type:complete